jgi:lipoprotein-anchoring transpeptidase ErfK/SrfK
MAFHKIVIDSKKQLLKFLSEEREIFSAPVSTSRAGLGFEPGSLKTPTGLFRIHEKIGENARSGTVFEGRVPIAEAAECNDDLITSRILWLDGLEKENANTKERYIYIHGTNQENLIGQPVSHGCIRMRNEDIVRLFDLVAVNTPVEIIG